MKIADSPAPCVLSGIIAANADSDCIVSWGRCDATCFIAVTSLFSDFDFEKQITRVEYQH